MTNKRIIVECKPDKQLVRLILQKYKVKAKIIHKASKGGKGLVFDTIEKEGDLIAVVDEDPGTPMARHPFYKKLRRIYQTKHLNIYLYPKNNNVVIELRPRLEGWLIRVIEEAKLKQYKMMENILHAKLSADPNLIVRIINSAMNNSGIFLELANNLIRALKDGFLTKK